MDDAEVRAELERIDPELAGLFDIVSSVDLMLKAKNGSTRTFHDNTCNALRLLAESQKALRGIIAECPEPKTGYGRRIVEIAKNACKEGK